jgi:copper chaperone NosL
MRTFGFFGKMREQVFLCKEKDEEENMKKGLFLVILLIVGLMAPELTLAQDDVKKHASCKYCGMNRAQFAHSRVFIEYEDGTSEGTCSIHCAAVDFALNIDKIPKTIYVGDYNTKQLVEVEKAIWVIGGSKPGVMTKRAKWAFAKKEDADKFKAENGGDLGTFDQAIKMAYEDMYQDTKMIQERRKMKKMQHKP